MDILGSNAFNIFIEMGHTWVGKKITYNIFPLGKDTRAPISKQPFQYVVLDPPHHILLKGYGHHREQDE